MIAKFVNKTEINHNVIYDLHFYYVLEGEEKQAEYSLGGVIFEGPFDSTDIINRAKNVATNFFPDEILTEIIFE